MNAIIRHTVPHEGTLVEGGEQGSGVASLEQIHDQMEVLKDQLTGDPGGDLVVAAKALTEAAQAWAEIAGHVKLDAAKPPAVGGAPAGYHYTRTGYVKNGPK